MSARRHSSFSRKALALAVFAAVLLLLFAATSTRAAEAAVEAEIETAVETGAASVDVDQIIKETPDAESIAHVTEAVVIDDEPVDADTDISEEEAARVVAEAEANAAKVAAEAEANAAKVAAEALASSSIREPRTYEGVRHIHWSAKVRPEGCAAVTHEYLHAISTRVAASNEKVRRARADLHEARSHAPEKAHKAADVLQRVEADAEASVRKIMAEFGGDMQKTCIAEVQDALAAQLERAQAIKNNFLFAWSRHFAVLQGSALMLYRTAQGVVQHLLEAWNPTYEAAWDFVYLYAEKALSAIDKAREPAYLNPDRDFLTYAGLYARGFSYAMVPVLTGAVAIWIVLIFAPVLLLGVFAPSFFYQVWWRAFILWNMYGLTFPTGYVNALSEYKSLLTTKQYSRVLDRAADAFFDVIGEETEGTFFNGMVVLFVLGCCLSCCLLLIYIWLSCFMRCARIGRRRRPAPSYPRRKPAPKVAPATSSKSKANAAATAKPGTKSAFTAAAKKKKN